MGLDNLISALTTNALDHLKDFDRQKLLSAGFSEATIRNWKRVHEAYYGPTTSPAKQRTAGEVARRRGLSVDKLALIERQIAKIKSPKARNKLRVRLLESAGDYRALNALVKKLLPGADTPPQKRITISGSRHGRRTMIITADEHDIADLEAALMNKALDATRPVAGQLLEHFLDLIRNGGGVPYAVPRPLLLIPLPEWTKILSGHGDDVTLGLTNGTTITGTEYLARYHAKPEYGLEAALFHPTEGAVNLYRDERFANQKQRDLAAATQPVCTSPDCRHAADHCEIHHITPWKDGGETNIGNLAPLCRYHNRVNDDDPQRATRGRIEMRGGTPVWVSPRGYERPNNRHPYGAMRSLFGPPRAGAETVGATAA
ncbi:HNH endonuclease [Corynebacterium sp. CCUG 65737]|uniref:HNH endonuclease signature motif containing protein n=1 Tax=Corynebacterium sp. CCUG 65737 TaxID=2823889 RepID=UPI00210E149D|nr:HNH endonuclease signature motif containing protein [Corynebacterium sp. CCUG 65737]MCQ4627447.1 HNH endonuclease [Corynebacterium sp. CCUG 65737]